MASVDSNACRQITRKMCRLWIKQLVFRPVRSQEPVTLEVILEITSQNLEKIAVINKRTPFLGKRVAGILSEPDLLFPTMLLLQNYF